MSTSTPGRTAWIVIGSVVTVVALVWGTFQAANVFALDTSDFRTRFERAVTSIAIDNDAGSVRIVGSDRDDVIVIGRITRSLRAPTHEELVIGDTLRVTSSCEWIPVFCHLDYEIQVPRDVRVVAHASGGGLDVTGITGELTLSSSGGGVSATRLRSEVVRADSSGGGATLRFTVAPRSVDASASGGGVEVTVPDDGTEYAVDASASGGGVDVEVPERDRSNRRIRVHSSGGGVHVIAESK